LAESIKKHCTTINPDWDNHLLEMINQGKSTGQKILPRPGIDPKSFQLDFLLHEKD